MEQSQKEMPFKLKNDESKAESIHQQTMQTMCMLFYNLMVLHIPTRFVTQWKIVKTIATRFNEDKILKQLDEIYHHIKINQKSKLSYTLATLQYVCARDGMYRLPLDYDRYDGGMVSLREMLEKLDEIETQIFDIFTHLSIKHDIQPEMEMQRQMFPDLGDAGIPQL